MRKVDDEMIALKKAWLIIIITAAIGGPFLASGMLKGQAANNTENIKSNCESINKLGDRVYSQDRSIAVVQTKIESIIKIVERIEKKLDR